MTARRKPRFRRHKPFAPASHVFNTAYRRLLEQRLREEAKTEMEKNDKSR